MEESNEPITLVSEDGEEVEFTLLELLTVNDNRYAVLLPEENPEDGAVILRVETEENGDEVLVDLDDEEEFEAVVSVLGEELDWDVDDEADEHESERS